MSKMDNKEIKKLRKAHVWPAVLFLIFYVLLSMAACVFFAVAVLSYFATDRMDAVYENVKNIGSLFPESSDPAEYERVLHYLETDTEYSDAIYLLDKNNHIIAGYGGATYDLDKDFDVAFLVEEGCCLCLDSESASHILDDDGNIDIRKISKELPQKSIGSLNDLRKKEVLLEDYFWVCVPASADRKLLVKTALVIYTTDLMLPLVAAVAACSIMFLPLLFLFGNVIVGVLNQRRMTQVLYMDVVTSGKNWMYYEDTAKKYSVLQEMPEKVMRLWI